MKKYGRRRKYGPRKMNGKRPPGGRGGRSGVRQNDAPSVQAFRSDGCKYTHPQKYEIKRRAVQLYLEEGIPAERVAQEVGVTHCTVFDWVRQYRENGEEGLRPQRTAHRTLNQYIT